MGRANALAAYLIWSGLDHGPHRALVYMALRSLDPPGGENGRPACVYYEGHAAIAAALGMVPVGTKDRDLTKSQKESIRRLVRKLENHGAVTRLSAGHRGAGAEYEVHVNPIRVPDRVGKVRHEGGRIGPPTEGTYAAVRGDQQSAVKADPGQLGPLTSNEEANRHRALQQVAGSQTGADEPQDPEAQYEAGKAKLHKRLGELRTTETIAALMAEGVDRHEAIERLVKELT